MTSHQYSTENSNPNGWTDNMDNSIIHDNDSTGSLPESRCLAYDSNTLV